MPKLKIPENQNNSTPAPLLSRMQNAQDVKEYLLSDGWVSPDTYDNYFTPISEISSVYLFLLHERDYYERAVVAYVGMSLNLSQRLSGHEIFSELSSSGCWPMRWFKPTPSHSLRALELLYIKQFDPPWNIAGRRRGVYLS